MGQERPSTALLAVLALTVALAGWVYGRPLLSGSDEAPAEAEVTEPATLGFADDDADIDDADTVEPWIPPAEPRDPFLPVELGVSAAETGRADADGATVQTGGG